MYNQINADQALAYANEISIQRILVVGSGEGADIIALRNRLGPEPLIVGVDIDIHADTFPTIPNTLVIQADITKGTMLGSCFDLAYSFATFEHIHDLEQGWQAMLNVLRPGGMLWSVASPLWCSPFGHHKPMFNQYPWVHLEYPTPQDLLSFCEQNAIEAEDGIAMIHHINYMFNPDCFNMLPASAYLQAAANLKGARLDINEVQLLGESGLSDKLIQLMKLGHQRTDLLGQTHMLVARRI